MAIARSIANELSKDRSTKVGALIVNKDNSPLCWGYNGFPRKANESEERHERPLKYKIVSHAESNAIDNAAREGIRLKGSRIYVSELPTCIECAKRIIQSGIRKVYIEEKALTVDRWMEDWPLVLNLYKECGVKAYVLPNDGSAKPLRITFDSTDRFNKTV